MKSLYRKYTFGIRKKIFIVFSFTGVVMLLLLGLSIFSVVYGYLRNDNIRYVNSLTHQLNNSIDEYYDEMKNVVINISNNENLRRVLNEDYNNDYDKYRTNTELVNYLWTTASVRKYTDVFIFMTGTRSLLSTDKTNNIDNYSNYGVEETTWYKKTISTHDHIILLNSFSPSVNYSSVDMFAAAYRFKSMKNGNGSCIIVLGSQVSFFDELLKDTNYNVLDFLIIADTSNNIIYCTNPRAYDRLKLNIGGSIFDLVKSGDSPRTIHSGKDSYLVTMNTSLKSGVNVVSFSSQGKLYMKVKGIILIMIGITVLFIFIISFVSYHFSVKLTRPLNSLMKTMKRTEERIDDVVFEEDIKNNDEIGMLSHSFNVMVRQVYNNQVLRKEAELSALQQQINPHFLYNTLSSMNCMAEVAGIDEISRISIMLADILRYNINREKQEFVMLQDEIDNVRNYMDIQNIRFSDRYKLVVTASSEPLHCKVIKLMLQPIVENSIHHGFNDMVGNCVIKIQCFRSGGDIVIKVKDNGKGIGEEMLRSLKQYVNEGEGKVKIEKKYSSIGLRNVHLRIALVYGQSYGLKIYSREGLGTSTVLRLPIMTFGEGLQVVQSTNS